MTRCYSVNGKAHRILTLLDRAPRGLEDIWRAEGLLEKPGPRRKAYYLVVGLVQEGFARRAYDLWHITTEGQTALAQLDAGHPVVTDAAPQISQRVTRPAA